MIECLLTFQRVAKRYMYTHATRMSCLFIVVVLPRRFFGPGNVPFINVEGYCKF